MEVRRRVKGGVVKREREGGGGGRGGGRGNHDKSERNGSQNMLAV